jgi:muramoyltetrapeptide carboxypeptidase
MSRPPALRKPRPLKRGDVVRVIAPASPFDPEQLHAGLDVLRSWGFKPRHRDDLFQRRHYLAGAPRRRAAELHEAFEDDDAAAIFAVRGGYGVATMLPLLDPKRLRNPKILCGCSDLTALLSWFVQETSTVAFHGPMVGALGRGDDDVGAARLLALLTSSGKPPDLTSALDGAAEWCVSPGIGRGRAVGGSLSLLASLCGTPWQVRTEGAVVFLEDVGERPYRIDRLLVQIAQAGAFEGAAGVVLGDFVGCDDGGGATARDAIERVLRPMAIPILAGVPFGHASPNLAFPVGVQVEVDAGQGVLRFKESALA